MSIQFPASKSLCNDLAKASEALDGKKIQQDVVNGLFGQNSEIDAEWFENNWNWLQYREDAFYVHVNVFRQLDGEGECYWN